MHLGRNVVVLKIVLRFAAEGEGDPFLRFQLQVWRHARRRYTAMRYTILDTDKPKLWEIGATDRPNKDQRVFEFVPPTTEQHRQHGRGENDATRSAPGQRGGFRVRDLRDGAS